jgi:hypothetical protein
MTDTLTTPLAVRGVLLDPHAPDAAPILHVRPPTPDPAALAALHFLMTVGGLPVGELDRTSIRVERPASPQWRIRVMGTQTVDVFMPTQEGGQMVLAEGVRVPGIWTRQACALGGALVIAGRECDWSAPVPHANSFLACLRQGFRGGLVEVNDLRAA